MYIRIASNLHSGRYYLSDAMEMKSKMFTRFGLYCLHKVEINQRMSLDRIDTLY